MKMSEMNEAEKKIYTRTFQDAIDNLHRFDVALKMAENSVEQFRKDKQPKTKDATSFLKESQNLLQQRGEERDNEATGERSVGRAVRAFWELYGDSILERGYMEEWEGWEFMSILKKSRKAYGKYVEDDYLDDVSYCALSGEAASEKDQ